MKKITHVELEATQIQPATYQAGNLVERFFNKTLARCNSLRQVGRKLSSLHPTCINPVLASRQ
jgi:hypothetical protein